MEGRCVTKKTGFREGAQTKTGGRDEKNGDKDWPKVNQQTRQDSCMSLEEKPAKGKRKLRKKKSRQA